MTRQPSPDRDTTTRTTPTPTSWVGHKDLARRQYERGEYEEALRSYTAALNPELRCPSSERQILLSNLVACRLKIGGPAQARAAVEASKQCIAINPQWAKGHVRLASAYIALGPRHSNDACNELQRALAIDPGNSTAREMLIKELRRDHAHASAAENSTTSATGGDNTNNSNDYHYPTEETTTRSEFDESSANSRQTPNNHHAAAGSAVDDSLTWSERIQFHFSRLTYWYQNQSDDIKTIFKITIFLLILYVAFGGRFGLEASRPRGNYGTNNVYNQYRRYGTTQQSQQSQQSQSSYPYNSGSSNNHQRRTSYNTNQRNNNDNYYEDDHYYYNNRGGGWASNFNMRDGGLPGMLMIGGIMFAGHRLGINPFQTMMFINLMQGGRRRRGLGGGGFGGMRFGGGGMGGMGRRGYGRRRF